ncbi:MAG: tRNA (5-methylaminomethyl-2-thiouridine)(34)-methyltransferase MnmD [Crocinitomicaceae bacterium]
MKREIIVTNDGSNSLYIPEMDETYHSVHGAIQEAKHVFIENGLMLFNKPDLRVFEVGFGTGLNAFLSEQYSFQNKIKINYHSIEAFPVEIELINKLNYNDLIEYNSLIFNTIHNLNWEEESVVSETFKLKKIEAKIQEFEVETIAFDIVFFDAFGPRAQGEMWSVLVLKKMYGCLISTGKLVTYCAQGQFKRDLKSIGFVVKNVPGPPGKREMTIATKP